MHFRSLKSADLHDKRVLVRVDFDVSFGPDHLIADDERIRRNIPTLQALLKGNNQLILIAKRGRPEGRDMSLSLKPIVKRLPHYLPGYTFQLIDDFLTKALPDQKPDEIFILENIRFYPEEEKCDMDFAHRLAKLGDVYVNDAFAMAHRKEASITGLPKVLPSYAGLLFVQEVKTITNAIEDPKRPLVTIIGGAKITDKIQLISRLIEKSDYLLIGGALANTFLKAQEYKIGRSFYEPDSVAVAEKLLQKADQHPVQLLLPVDVRLENGEIRQTALLDNEHIILDIGPQTEEIYTNIISHAYTVIWNGPMGKTEDISFRKGTTAIFEALIHNTKAFTLVGGGDTLGAIGHKPHLDRIDHISTGGGAMLELIEKGTLPGIEALMD